MSEQRGASVSLHDLARRLGAAGEGVAASATEVAGLDPGPRAFGADAGGLPGELGRALHALTTAALAARSREAAAHGARLLDSADLVTRVVGDYRGVDDTAHIRHSDGER
jgi:hypothetical protein